MTLFALLSVLVTSGSQAVYGEAIWDPVQLAAKTDNVFGLLFALVTVLVATLSVNIAANVVSPAYDFSNLAPRIINFRTGALITGVVGVLIFPWKLYSRPAELYIFTWLGLVGGLLGTVAGILIADYWILRRTRARPRRPVPGGRTLLVRQRLELACGRRLRWSAASWPSAAPTSRPSSTGRPIRRPDPVPQPLADYGWAVGLGTSMVLYLVLMVATGKGRDEAQAQETTTV